MALRPKHVTRTLVFLGGGSKDSQLGHVAVNKEGLAIVNTLARLHYLLWNGFRIFTDHRNLNYIANLDECVTSVMKAMARRLEIWIGVPGQYRNAIEHSLGELN